MHNIASARPQRSSNESETAVCGSLFEDLNDWEVITGCHQNRTSVPQLIETSVYFQLVRHKSRDMICQIKNYFTGYQGYNIIYIVPLGACPSVSTRVSMVSGEDMVTSNKFTFLQLSPSSSPVECAQKVYIL